MWYILGRLLTVSSCTPKPAQELNCCCRAEIYKGCQQMSLDKVKRWLLAKQHIPQQSTGSSLLR